MSHEKLDKRGWSNDEAVNLYVKTLAENLAKANEYATGKLEQVEREYDIIPEL